MSRVSPVLRRISSSKKDVLAKHQHVPDLFWSLTEVVGMLITSVNVNPFTESAGSVSLSPAYALTETAAAVSKVSSPFIYFG